MNKKSKYLLNDGRDRIFLSNGGIEYLDTCPFWKTLNDWFHGAKIFSIMQNFSEQLFFIFANDRFIFVFCCITPYSNTVGSFLRTLALLAGKNDLSIPPITTCYILANCIFGGGDWLSFNLSFRKLTLKLKMLINRMTKCYNN